MNPASLGRGTKDQPAAAQLDEHGVLVRLHDLVYGQPTECLLDLETEQLKLARA